MVVKYMLLYLFSKLMNLVKSVVQAENLFLSAEVETLEEALRIFGAERERRQHRYHLPDLLRRVEGPRQHRCTTLTDRRPEQICKKRLLTMNYKCKTVQETGRNSPFYKPFIIRSMLNYDPKLLFFL